MNKFNVSLISILLILNCVKKQEHYISSKDNTVCMSRNHLKTLWTLQDQLHKIEIQMYLQSFVNHLENESKRERQEAKILQKLMYHKSYQDELRNLIILKELHANNTSQIASNIKESWKNQITLQKDSLSQQIAR